MPTALVSATTAAGLYVGTLAAVFDAGRLVQRGRVGELRAAPASLAVAAAVADGPLISIPGIVEDGRLRVAGRPFDVPRVFPPAGMVDVVLPATSVTTGAPRRLGRAWACSAKSCGTARTNECGCSTSADPASG